MNASQPSKVSHLFKCLLIAGFTSTLVACGSSDSPAAATPTQAAAADLTAPISTTVVGALFAQPGGAAPVSVFPNGFTGVDGAGAPAAITGSTSVSFGGTTATPTFTVTNGASTASGTMSFGSCIFTITSTSFSAASSFGPGKTFKVDPCTVTVNAQGVAVNTVTSRSVTLTFSSGRSTTFSLPVLVGANGSVGIGGVTLGTVTLLTSTGGTN